MPMDLEAEWGRLGAAELDCALGARETKKAEWVDVGRTLF